MLKRLITLSLIFIGAITLTACGGDDALTTEEILEQIAEAVDELSLPATTSTDLTLPSTGVHDVVVTWASSDTDFISDAGVVTIPTFTQGNQNVVMTASLTLEDQTLTKTFTVTVTAATALNDAEKVAADLADVYVPEGETFDNVTLDTMGDEGSTITWTSSHPAVISVTGVVTRPAPDAGNVTVTLTATVTSGTESGTKTFDLIVVDEVFTLAISALKDDISATTPTIKEGDVIAVKGIVVALVTEYYKGYYIYDGTGSLFVFLSETDPTVAVGDVVFLEGLYDDYYGLAQITTLSTQEVISEVIAAPAAVEKTIADVIAYGTAPGVYKQSDLISLTGNVVYDGTRYYYLEDESGNKLELYDAADISDLTALVGKNITAEFIYHNYHGGHGYHQISYAGTVVENTLSEVDALAADIALVDGLFPEASYMNITLPTVGANGTVYTNWVSDMTAVYTDAGVFVARGTETVTVTFTATATNGAETGTATATVVVPLEFGINAAAALAEDSYAVITGVVYSESYYGYHIFANGEYTFIADKTYLDDIVEGDELTIVVQHAGKYHDAPQFNSVSYVVNSQGNTLPTATVVELGDVINVEYAFGMLVTVTGKIVEEPSGNYFNLFIEDAAGNRIQIHYNSHDYIIDDFKDKIVTTTMIVYASDYIWFNGELTDITEVTTGFTEAEQAYAVAVALELGLGDLDQVSADLVLPATFTAPAATVTWASDTPAVIALDGTVVQTFGANEMVTLTVTVTVGATTVTRDIMVTVLDADMGDPLTVADALLEANGETVLITGVITGFNYKGEAFIQDVLDGTALFLDTTIDDEVAIGDLVVVRGELGINTYSDNDQRKLVDVAVIEIKSSDNALFIKTDVLPATLGVLATVGTYSSQIFTMDLTIAQMDLYGYTTFTGDGTTFLKMYTADHDYFRDMYILGDTITMTFNVYNVGNSDITIEGVILPALTDAETLTVVKNLIAVGATVISDVELSTELADYDATIVWTSDNAAITTAGVVTRPAAGEADVTVTLTATITIGTQTAVVETYTVVVPAPTPDLFISEYAEKGNEKGLELYNPTDAAIDLSNYVIKVNFNANTTWGSTLELTGMLAAGETYVIVYDDATGTELIAAADLISGNIGFNGDDAIGLFKNDILIDLFGIFGEDPGSAWVVGTGTTENCVLTRDPSIIYPNSTWDTTEWVVGVNLDYSDLGTHTVN